MEKEKEEAKDKEKGDKEVDEQVKLSQGKTSPEADKADHKEEEKDRVMIHRILLPHMD